MAEKADIVVENKKAAVLINTEYIRPEQSADTLFNFMRKSDFLYMIFEQMAIIPRYYKEEIDYLDIGMNEIAYPMVCFCDINLHRIAPHMRFYGGYGIAFSKEWGIKNKIQPIQYINRDSGLRSDYTEAFKAALADMPGMDSFQNYIQTQMYYLKPIDGMMEVNGVMCHKNFTDECEWRYIPAASKEGLVEAITEDKLYSIGTWNDAMREAKDCWLTFEPNDIKYIIIQNRDELDNLIQIFKDKKYGEEQIYSLVSKVIIWTESERDF